MTSRSARVLRRPLGGLRCLLCALLGAVACGTDAVGVEDCRVIEFSRCEQASACGTVEDVEACRRYYRGHCLHGLALGSRPPRDERDACVAAIERAGACAREQGPDTAPDACDAGPPATALPERTLQTTCDVVARPWETTACGFLTPVVVPDPTPGEGGAPSTDPE